MQIHDITSMDEFDRLRGPWDAIYAADPLASAFLQWGWMRGWFEASPYGWCVLAARDESTNQWLGFFPVSMLGGQSPLRVDQVREIRPAGNPVADYNGMVCVPDRQDEVVSALAQHFSRSLRWDVLRLKDILDPRIEQLVSRLEGGASVQWTRGICCPYIELPGTWEEYLTEHVSYESRASLRRKMRRAQRHLRFCRLSDVDHPSAVDSLVTLSQYRTRVETDPHLDHQRTILRWAVETGIADLFMLLDGQRLVAAVASMTDRKRQTLGLIMTAFDERDRSLSPGRVVNALWIQHAIEHGIREVDFYRGEEPYKFQFGAQCRYTQHVRVLNSSFGSTARHYVANLRSRLGV
jgi:CelD/BcsL family acetyltransferase involved in cellulose biosynthesis